MQYSFLFVWMAVMLLVKSFVRAEHQTIENGYEQTQVSRLFAVAAFAPILYLAAIEPAQGDVPLYIFNYKALPDSLDGLLAYLSTLEDSYFFWGLAGVIRIVTGANVTVFRIVVALMQSIPVIYICRKYSDNYLLSIYLFIASAYPLAWMMNGIRQFVAVTIIFAGAPLIEKKKYWNVVLVILFATMFHQTAILMLPVVFIAQGKAWNRRTMLWIVAAIIAVCVFTNISGSYESVMQSTGYSIEVYASDDGTNPLRVLVSFVPVLLAFVGRHQIEKDNIPIINLSVNMSILAFGVYLVSMVTSGILVGRVPVYMSMYNLILLPYLIKRLFTVNSYRLMVGLTVGCYALYYYIQYGIS